MSHEKFGWLLSYWNASGVPMSYSFGAVHMALRDPARYAYPSWVYWILFPTLLIAHIIFDQAMGQKSYIKAVQSNTYIKRYTFPQIPGTELKNPKFIVTETGSKLLVSGWWGVVRKPS